jgi:hypothetical protein
LQSAVSSMQPQLLQRKNDIVPISCLRPQHLEETSIAAEIEFGVVTGNGNPFFPRHFKCQAEITLAAPWTLLSAFICGR